MNCPEWAIRAGRRDCPMLRNGRVPEAGRTWLTGAPGFIAPNRTLRAPCGRLHGGGGARQVARFRDCPKPAGGCILSPDGQARRAARSGRPARRRRGACAHGRGACAPRGRLARGARCIVHVRRLARAVAGRRRACAPRSGRLVGNCRSIGAHGLPPMMRRFGPATPTASRSNGSPSPSAARRTPFGCARACCASRIGRAARGAPPTMRCSGRAMRTGCRPAGSPSPSAGRRWPCIRAPPSSGSGTAGNGRRRKMLHCGPAVRPGARRATSGAASAARRTACCIG